MISDAAERVESVVAQDWEEVASLRDDLEAHLDLVAASNLERRK